MKGRPSIYVLAAASSLSLWFCAIGTAFNVHPPRAKRTLHSSSWLIPRTSVHPLQLLYSKCGNSPAEWNRDVSRKGLKDFLSVVLSVATFLCGAACPSTAFESSGIDYKCLTCQCGASLLKSLSDPRALVELTCLGTCKKDDFDCLIKCSNMYDKDVLRDFNLCAISDRKCIPQWQNSLDIGSIDLTLLPKRFDPRLFSGHWNIVYGLNPVFDCYACQHHSIYGTDGRLLVDVQYDISPSFGASTFHRKLQHIFVQNPTYPAVFHASDQSYLHQSDDWYILDADPEKYIFVYYTGCNDAMCGYVGGIVYSKETTLDAETEAKLTETADKFGVKLSNACAVSHSKCLNTYLSD